MQSQMYGMGGSQVPLNNNGSMVPEARMHDVGQMFSPSMAAMRTAPRGPTMSLQSMGIGNFDRNTAGITAQGRQAGQSFNPYANSGVSAGQQGHGGPPPLNPVQMARMQAGQAPPQMPPNQHGGAATAAYGR